MDQATERQLMRWLHGELTAAEVAALERRLEEEPELAARYRRLQEVWGSLELAPEAPVPAGFATRVMAEVGSSGSSPARSALRPQWAAALALGIILGVGAGLTLPEPPPQGPPVEEVAGGALASLEQPWEDEPEDAWPWPEPAGSLADEYWRALDEIGRDEAGGGEEL